VDGVKSTSIEGLVDYWIQYPNTQGVMPSMLVKGQDAQDVAAYVAAVAAIPGQDSGALARAVAAKVNPTPAVGKTIFTGVGSCGSCHTLAAAGTTGTVGPSLNTLKTACAAPASQQARGSTLQKCIETAITDPYKYLPPGYKAGIMPNTFAKTLSPSQIQALVAFLSSVSK
jgi:mono/diheme cytochrome c family protein